MIRTQLAIIMHLVTLLQLEKTMQLVIDDCGAAGTEKT